MIWADERGGDALGEMAQAIDPIRVLEITGNPLTPGFSAAKMTWLRVTEPDVWRRASYSLGPKDLIRARLIGEINTDPSDASGTLLFDVRARTWSSELADAWHFDLDGLPPNDHRPTSSGRCARARRASSDSSQASP